MASNTDNSIAKRKMLFLGGFVVYFGVVWLLWDTPAIYPLKIFVVLLHEISHGLTSIATGGTIERIVLDPYQGGACYCGGGNAFLTLSAGYLGSLVWGVLLLSAAQATRVSNRMVIGAVGVVVLALTIFFVRSGFGFAFGLAFGVTLLMAARKLGPTANTVILTGLGLTSCLYAILDIKSDVLDRPHLRSDAAMLAELTSIPTTFWGALWIGIALVVSFFAFRRAYRAA